MNAFTLHTDDPATDDELRALLTEVYVGGGFVTSQIAQPGFEGERVRARGTLIGARDASGALLGMVILCPPDGTCRQIATGGESEIHLLGVSQSARGMGLGRQLMQAAIKLSQERGWPRVVLSTQPDMKAAHRLYERLGFTRAPQRDWDAAGSPRMAFVLGGRPTPPGGE